MGKKITFKSYIISTSITIGTTITGILLVVFSTYIKLLPQYFQWIGFAFVTVGFLKSFYDRWKYRVSEWNKIED